MGKSTYSTTAIRPGMTSKYREFWVEGKTVSEDGTPLSSDLLATSDIVEAKNTREAEKIAQAKYPEHTIIAARLG